MIAIGPVALASFGIHSESNLSLPAVATAGVVGFIGFSKYIYEDYFGKAHINEKMQKVSDEYTKDSEARANAAEELWNKYPKIITLNLALLSET